MTDHFLEQLRAGTEALQLSLQKEQEEQLFSYYQMVIETNKVMNLTAITEEVDFVQKHIIDSLAIVRGGESVCRLLAAKGTRLIDVGTGAGLPGMVLKICWPGLRVTLFDSLKKRLRFLDEVIEKLGLSSVETLHGRAEDVGQDPRYRGQYDLTVSRAVANLSTLSEYCLPFVKTGGLFLSYKAGNLAEELAEAGNAVRILGGRLLAEEAYQLPESDIKRELLLIRKEKETPGKYPRKAGIPAREPLH